MDIEEIEKFYRENKSPELGNHLSAYKGLVRAVGCLICHGSFYGMKKETLSDLVELKESVKEELKQTYKKHKL